MAFRWLIPRKKGTSPAKGACLGMQDAHQRFRIHSNAATWRFSPICTERTRVDFMPDWARLSGSRKQYDPPDPPVTFNEQSVRLPISVQKLTNRCEGNDIHTDNEKSGIPNARRLCRQNRVRVETRS